MESPKPLKFSFIFPLSPHMLMPGYLDRSGKQPLDKDRREVICEKIRLSLGQGTLVELKLAGPECSGLDCAPHLPALVPKDLFDEGQYDLVSSGGKNLFKTLSCPTLPTMTKLELENTVSPVHTSMQIECRDRKGLFYDCMRTLKDNNMQVCHYYRSRDSTDYS